MEKFVDLWRKRRFSRKKDDDLTCRSRKNGRWSRRKKTTRNASCGKKRSIDVEKTQLDTLVAKKRCWTGWRKRPWLVVLLAKKGTSKRKKTIRKASSEKKASIHVEKTRFGRLVAKKSRWSMKIAALVRRAFRKKARLANEGFAATFR